MKYTHLIIFILIVVASMPSSGKTRYGQYSNNNKERETVPPKPSRGSVLSAWGIVFLVVGGIVLGVVVYYMTILYPLVCKKERKYDRIELSTV